MIDSHTVQIGRDFETNNLISDVSLAEGREPETNRAGQCSYMGKSDRLHGGAHANAHILQTIAILDSEQYPRESLHNYS